MQIAWEPQFGPQTKAFLSARIPELFFGGARGGGKTSYLLGDYLSGVPHYGRHWQGILFRKNYADFEEVLRQAATIYPQTGATFRASPNPEYRWPNGARLRFRFLESEKHADKYQGHQYTWIGWDELPQWKTDYAYKALFACLRWSDADVPTKRVRATGNPGGPGHGWVKKLFIDPAPLGDQLIYNPKTKKPRVFYLSKVGDNRILMENDPDYVARLADIGSPELVRAWLEGDWNVMLGAYFPQLTAAKHVIPVFDIPKSWTTFFGFDWGSARPFAAVWGAISNGEGNTSVPKGAAVIYREAYGGSDNVGWGWHAEQTADYILNLQGKDVPTIRRADPSIWAESGGPSIAERMLRRGLTFTPGDNKRLAGWDQIRARLVGEDDRPMLYICDNCPNTFRSLSTLQHDRLHLEDADSSGDDHPADALRYALMSRPYSKPTKVIGAPHGIERGSLNDLWQLQEREDRKWA